MTAATQNGSLDAIETGLNGVKRYDLTFAASGDTFACGSAVKEYWYSPISMVAATSTISGITESSGTFTLTGNGTAFRVFLFVKPKR